jgi:peroxiredoxin
MVAHFSEMMAELEAATSDSKRQSLARKISKEYVSYNIQSRKYVVENSRSLSVISVLYRQLGDLPVFSELIDALLFDSTADSLQKAYPDSRYAMAFRAAADQKLAEMELQNMIDQAEPIGYFDVELPDFDAQMKKLSDLDAKVILLYFWSASQPEQNIFNVENLKPLYESYHKKGFDIFQVSLDSDKVMWANAIKGQELPWTNVCDIRGVDSPYISMYNLQALPSAFVISNGELVDGEIVDEASFRKLLDKLLK